jgi:eukaryotic-like serine/threonine-protein kinase
VVLSSHIRDDDYFPESARFELRRRLGAGGFGVVYEAFDRERGSLIALKALRRAGDDALYRFKHEFRTLADITHPNLVSLYELLSLNGRWFFTMELIQGLDFLSHVCSPAEPLDKTRPMASRAQNEAPTSTLQEPLRIRKPAQLVPLVRSDFARLRSALSQAASGVFALHCAGKLHRDIKSSNVLVTESGRVVVLDFGLVAELGPTEDDGQSMVMAGTPTYMSPEQGAGQPVSEASDWYSLGVMLYEALTGCVPFRGTKTEMILQKLQREPAAPHELVSGVPEDLDRLCCGLLRRDPRQRPKADTILRSLGGHRGVRRTSTATQGDARGIPFVGRRNELARLQEAFLRSEAGQAVTVAVHGGSGMGKSALVRRFLETLRASGEVVVMSGRCFERESVPYKALDSLMDGLSHYLKQLPDSRVQSLMPRDVLALARLFPVLRRVEAVAAARRRVLEIRDVHELRRRAFEAFRELMARAASEAPLVLFIDDLHWGDVDSAALLEELMRPPDPPPLLLILAYRSEEADTSPMLRRLLPGKTDQWQEIEIGRLDDSETRDLARALLGEEPDSSHAVVDTVARESAGNPFFLSELARSVRNGEEDQDEERLPIPGSLTESSLTLDHVIQSRVSRLPVSARRFLEVVAVAGRPVAFAVAREAALPETQENVIEILRVRHLIRTRETDSREEIESYHDRIREAVVAALSPEELKSHHRRLALALETHGPADPEWLALHWKEGGDSDRAAEYATAAARQASDALAFERAARLFLLALDLPSRADLETRRKLRVSLGDALANAGRGAEAANAYLVAAEKAPVAEGLELQRRAAEQLVRSGHIDQGIPLLKDVLRRVGFHYPETALGSLLSFLFHRFRIRLRGLSFRERDVSQIAPEQLIRIDTCWSASLGLSMIDTLRGRDFQGLHLLLALKAGEPYRVARAVANEAGYSGTLGPRRARRTAALVAKATELAERVGHPQAIGISQVAVGITALAEGRWKRAWELAERAQTILRERCTGAVWELDTTQHYSLRALFYLGHVAELCTRLPALLREAKERDDLFAETSLRTRHSYVFWLAADQPDNARAEIQDAIARWSSRAFYMQHYYALVAEADTALYRGQSGGALQLLRERKSALQRSRLLRVHHLRIEWLHLLARSLVASAAEMAGPQSLPLLQEAETTARRIERERVSWGDALAALVRAGIASIRGNREEAASRLAFCASHTAMTDMGLYAAAGRLRLGSILGGEKGKALAASSDAWMRNQKILNPAGFASMLVPGKWE